MLTIEILHLQKLNVPDKVTDYQKSKPNRNAMEQLINRITLDQEICHGKPVIRGLRYPVENMLELLASGMSIEELLDDYPDLEREDFLACIAYAAKLSQVKSIYSLAS
jgi:uncharacterized protein (DUF433 family)